MIFAMPLSLPRAQRCPRAVWNSYAADILAGLKFCMFRFLALSADNNVDNVHIYALEWFVRRGLVDCSQDDSLVWIQLFMVLDDGDYYRGCRQVRPSASPNCMSLCPTADIVL